MPVTSKERRLAALISLLFGALFMLWKLRNKVVAIIAAEVDVKRQRRRLQQQQQPPRPRIHTFYAPLQRAKMTVKEQRIQETDQRLLEAWKQSWRDAGWDPVVLDMGHAQQHPMYASYLQSLQQQSVQIVGKGGRNQEYNEYCFLRYLAMAHVGGGIMADYDLFPLHQPTSPYYFQQARFTIHQKTKNKAGGVPSLCSGRASEWERIARDILSIAQSKTIPTPKGWSDMLALMYLHKTLPESQIIKDEVTGYKELKESPNPCLYSQDRWAVHFSHYDVHETGNNILYRPELALSVLKEYNQMCKVV